MPERIEDDSEQEEFYDVKFDRTPYGSCWMVAAITGGIVFLGIALLWSSAGYVKKHTRNWRLPQSDSSSNLMSDIESRLNPKVKSSVTPPNPADVQNQLQNKLEDTASKAVQDAAAKAAAQAQQELLRSAQTISPSIAP